MFRILALTDSEIHAFDFRGMPVVIKRTSHDYSDSLTTKIDSLKPGNRVRAALRAPKQLGDGDDPPEVDAWCFDDLELIADTRFYHGDLPIIDTVDDVCDQLDNSDATQGRGEITHEDLTVGQVLVQPADTDDHTTPRTEEEIMDHLEPLAPPPYEVYFTTARDGRYNVTYYFADGQNPLSKRLQGAVQHP